MSAVAESPRMAGAEGSEKSEPSEALPAARINSGLKRPSDDAKAMTQSPPSGGGLRNVASDCDWRVRSVDPD